MQYIAHIGRNKELSVAELGSYFGFDSLIQLDGDFLFIDSDDDFDQIDVDKLGSAQALYKVVSELEKGSDVKKLICGDLSELDRKISVSLEGIDDARFVLRDVKKDLKSQTGIAIRFIEKPSTAAILGSGFLKEKVAAYRVVKTLGKSYLCKLVGLQNIDAYSKRDYEKPYRDAKLGMLPPKLAQVMINLAGSGSIYDPFCGTGTVLIEGLLAGRDVKGSDIQERNIEGSQSNIDWLRENVKFEGKVLGIDVLDARSISDLSSVDAIATEGYLGDPKSGDESLTDLGSEMDDIEKLYFEFLSTVSKAAQNDLNIVVCLPVYVSEGKRVYMENLVEKVKPLGYSVSALIPEDNNLGLSKKESLVYQRRDQKVLRQIVKLRFIPR